MKDDYSFYIIYTLFVQVENPASCLCVYNHNHFIKNDFFFSDINAVKS